MVTIVTDAVTNTLRSKGLKDIAGDVDLVVDWKVTAVDFSIGAFGRPNAIVGRGGRGGRGGAVDFTEATLVLDLSRRTPEALVWRGVFHDSENDAAKLAAALPKDATELLGEFPPRRRN